MKVNWILIALLSGIVGGGITYGLTSDWTYALIVAVIILVVVIIHNPATRYMKAFYVAIFPLLSNFYFTLSTKTDNFDLKAGLEEIDATTTAFLGTIAIVCLILDYLQRNGKLKGTFLEINKNVVKNASGTNIHIHQNINKKDTDA